MKNPNHIFYRRHIHIGYNPLEDDRDHPLKGVSGYLVDVSEMSVAGFDAVFVPDMGLEEFKIRTNSVDNFDELYHLCNCLLYTSPSPRDATLSRMPSSA